MSGSIHDVGCGGSRADRDETRRDLERSEVFEIVTVGRWARLLCHVGLLIVISAWGAGCSDSEPREPSVTAELTVRIEGLMGAAVGMVRVSGSEGFEQVIEQTQTLKGLAPATYFVTAEPVSHDGMRFEVKDIQPSQRLLDAGDHGTVTVTYQALEGVAVRPASDALWLSFDETATLDLAVFRGTKAKGAVTLELTAPNGVIVEPETMTVREGLDQVQIQLTHTDARTVSVSLGVRVRSVDAPTYSDEQSVDLHLGPYVTKTTDSSPAEPGQLRYVVGHPSAKGQRISFHPQLFAEPRSLNLKETLTLSQETELVGPAWTGETPLVTLQGPGGFPLVRAETADPLTLKNLRFTGGENTAGAGAGLIVRGDFTGEGLHFFQNRSTGGKGGALFFGSGHLELMDVLFEDNVSKGGAAIYLADATARIESGMFLRNETVGENLALSGGAIELLNSRLTVEYSEFRNNRGESGGAIFALYDALTVRHSHFEGNEATASGGAISSVSELTLSDSTFVSNHSRSGAINQGGGALDLRVSAEIRDCVFSENTSAGDGGAIQNVHELELHNVTLEKNRSEALGGALYSAGIAKVYGSVFRHNEAKAGGAVYNHILNGALIEGKAREMLLQTTTLENNTASQNGGGAIATTGALSLNTCDVSYNTAEVDGGGIEMIDTGGTPAVASLDLRYSSIHHNDAERGGGVKLGAGAFYGVNSTVASNTAVRGGGLFFDSGGAANRRMSFMTIYRNEAENSGGGVFFVGNARPELKACAIGQNRAPVEPDIGPFSRFTSMGYNLISDAWTNNCLHAFDICDVDPGFKAACADAMSSCEGEPYVFHLRDASQLWGAIPAGECTDVGGARVRFDQIGTARPSAVGCTIGAIEYAGP